MIFENTVKRRIISWWMENSDIVITNQITSKSGLYFDGGEFLGPALVANMRGGGYAAPAIRRGQSDNLRGSMSSRESRLGDSRSGGGNGYGMFVSIQISIE